jgi:hypothetical protein
MTGRGPLELLTAIRVRAGSHTCYPIALRPLHCDRGVQRHRHRSASGLVMYFLRVSRRSIPEDFLNSSSANGAD